MESLQKKKKSGTSVKNLVWWLRILYWDSPGYVLAYLADIPLQIGIALLGSYMPSVLVADITAGKAIYVILRNLIFLGGALAGFYVIQQWSAETRKMKENRICGAHSLKLFRAALNAEYRDIEQPEFQTEFMKRQELHLWSGTYTRMFMTLVSTAAAG